MLDRLVPFCTVIQPQMAEDKLKPMAGHRGTVDRVGVPGPQLLKQLKRRSGKIIKEDKSLKSQLGGGGVQPLL
jgi:hypothetical protein